MAELDVLGGNSTNGNQIGLWDCADGESQQWGFNSDAGAIRLDIRALDATKCNWMRSEKNLWKVCSELEYPFSVVSTNFGMFVASACC